MPDNNYRDRLYQIFSAVIGDVAVRQITGKLDASPDTEQIIPFLINVAFIRFLLDNPKQEGLNFSAALLETLDYETVCMLALYHSGNNPYEEMGISFMHDDHPKWSDKKCRSAYNKRVCKLQRKRIKKSLSDNKSVWKRFKKVNTGKAKYSKEELRPSPLPDWLNVHADNFAALFSEIIRNVSLTEYADILQPKDPSAAARLMFQRAVENRREFVKAFHIDVSKIQSADAAVALLTCALQYEKLPELQPFFAEYFEPFRRALSPERLKEPLETQILDCLRLCVAEALEETGEKTPIFPTPTLH